MEQVEVWRGAHGDPAPLFGPLPGIRLGNTLAYEFQLPDSFVPWPGRTLLVRVFVLLDLGVSMSIPAWRSTLGTDRAKTGPTWTDFPPQRLHDLAALPSPLGPIVTAPS